MQILVLIDKVWASPHVGEILPLCDFFDCPVRPVRPVLFSRERAGVEPLNRFSRFMAQTTFFRVRKCLVGVRMIGDVIWGKMSQPPPPKKKWA